MHAHTQTHNHTPHKHTPNEKLIFVLHHEMKRRKYKKKKKNKNKEKLAKINITPENNREDKREANYIPKTAFLTFYRYM